MGENENKKRLYPELRVRGIANTKRQLENIAWHKGIDFDIFIKSELIKIVDSYPEKYRQPPPNY